MEERKDREGRKEKRNVGKEVRKEGREGRKEEINKERK